MFVSSVTAAAALLFTGAYATHFDVTVGKNDQLRFEPEEIDAEVGDTITYHFFSKNHAVTQSSFREPCQYLDDGIFSGFVPTESADVEAYTTFTIAVHNASRPIWLYCAQTGGGGHCQNGMVHAINAPREGATLEAYREAAKSAPPSTAREDLRPFGGIRAVDVQVAPEGDLRFEPNEMQEPVGTHLRFHFNPANHSVVQASFFDPCSPLKNSTTDELIGFSSGFIPIEDDSKDIQFEVEILQDSPPTWFYCAQVAPNAAADPGHCQKGMVGSVNAPKEGNFTLAKFIEDAAAFQPPSLIPPEAPQNGILTVDGVVISKFEGNVLDINAPPDDDYIKYVPKPGERQEYIIGQAGGGPIAHYNWGQMLSRDAIRAVNLIHFLDNIILTSLWEAHAKMDEGGEWEGIYPETIVSTIGTMKAQAYIHRTIATDTLQHYNEPVKRPCSYKIPMDTVDDWLDATTRMLNLQIGLYSSYIAKLSHSDSWIVPCLATSMGAKSRMAGVISMMHNHMACAAPREVGIPDYFVYAYAWEHYVESCPDDYGLEPGVLLNVIDKKMLNATDEGGLTGASRVTIIRIEQGDEIPTDKKLYMGWLGPWGNLEYTEINQDGYTDVPTDLYGYAWAVVTDSKDATIENMQDYAVAGPEMIWVSQPF